MKRRMTIEAAAWLMWAGLFAGWLLGEAFK